MRTRTLVLLVILLLLIIRVVVAVASPVGIYDCTGTQAGGETYQMRLVVEELGSATFEFSWQAQDAARHVWVTLLGGKSGYTLQTGENNNTAVVTIADNDKPVFDLDVNANGSLTDKDIDLAENYLPGYEGKVAKISSGAFNKTTYAGQKMKLILDHVGTGTVGITKVSFALDDGTTTSWPGYTSNGKAAEVTGDKKELDYSFSPAEAGTL